MKLQILADLHHEFIGHDKAGAAGWAKMQNTHADVTVVTGDLHTKGRSIDLAARMWPVRPAILVAGNHEFYGSSWPAHINTLRDKAAEHDNVHFLENDAVEIEGVVFLGCTLWTDCKLWEAGPGKGLFSYPQTIREIETGLNDYRSIRFSGPGGKYRTLKPSDTIQAHLDSVRWLKEQLEAHKGRRVIVVTHHAPSFKSIPEQYQRDVISAAFASHLDDLVRDSGAALWLHGHNHGQSDYQIGKTRVICNARGYPGENTGYNPSLVVEV